MVPLVHSCPGGTCLLGTHGLDRNTSLTLLARPPCSPHSRPAARPRTRSQGSGVKQESHRTQLTNASSNTNMRLSSRHVRSAPRTALFSFFCGHNHEELSLGFFSFSFSTHSSSLSLRSAPFFGRVPAISANRGWTRLLPSSPSQVIFYTPRKTKESLLCRHTTVEKRSSSCVRFWRELPPISHHSTVCAGVLRGKPCRFSIHPAGNVATRCTLVVGSCLMGWRCSELDGCCVEGARSMM